MPVDGVMSSLVSMTAQQFVINRPDNPTINKAVDISTTRNGMREEDCFGERGHVLKMVQREANPVLFPHLDQGIYNCYSLRA